MNEYNNLYHIKFFGLDISKDGQLATIAQQEEIKRLIRSVKSIVEVESGIELDPDGNKIILFLLDGNRTIITGFGQSNLQITQIINEVSYNQIVNQPELRILLDNISQLHSY